MRAFPEIHFGGWENRRLEGKPFSSSWLRRVGLKIAWNFLSLAVTAQRRKMLVRRESVNTVVSQRDQFSRSRISITKN